VPKVQEVELKTEGRFNVSHSFLWEGGSGDGDVTVRGKGNEGEKERFVWKREGSVVFRRLSGGERKEKEKRIPGLLRLERVETGELCAVFQEKDWGVSDMGGFRFEECAEGLGEEWKLVAVMSVLAIMQRRSWKPPKFDDGMM